MPALIGICEFDKNHFMFKNHVSNNEMWIHSWLKDHKKL